MSWDIGPRTDIYSQKQYVLVEPHPGATDMDLTPLRGELARVLKKQSLQLAPTIWLVVSTPLKTIGWDDIPKYDMGKLKRSKQSTSHYLQDIPFR